MNDDEVTRGAWMLDVDELARLAPKESRRFAVDHGRLDPVSVMFVENARSIPMTYDEYEEAKAKSRASAKPGEWCDECDDWSANCPAGADCAAEAEEERHMRESEAADESEFAEYCAYREYVAAEHFRQSEES